MLRLFVRLVKFLGRHLRVKLDLQWGPICFNFSR